jgi:hypothetical protein
MTGGSALSGFEFHKCYVENEDTPKTAYQLLQYGTDAPMSSVLAFHIAASFPGGQQCNACSRIGSKSDSAGAEAQHGTRGIGGAGEWSQVMHA